ncbi:hypothetical protein GCM10008904_11110 [Paraclostridium ghonii]|uniref:PepSY domain-containing protein n=1 Tax=Paraclostridium ghonii TaxID=29358 RepID=A0ABU0N4H6_9FIRM|nr:hypothetical protein [Paeniclostridium ghonii]MDQ0558061.1 hypothetical protein [Paeniclostridium ghonii]
MSKKNIIIGSIIVVIVILAIFINRKNSLNLAESRDTKQIETSNLKDNKDVEPISKENAIKVLKATYGDGVCNIEDDLKQVGSDYVVEVKVCIEDEGDAENHDHINEQSIGTHKIDIYTGEIKDTK